jgi:hypothetical protein
MYFSFRHLRLTGWSAALLALVCATSAVSYADEPTLDQEIQTIRTQTEAQRQATMAANVIMTDAEEAAFWPIYREYRGEVAKINDGRIALMKDLAANFDTLTDAKAKSITAGWLASEKERIELKTKYAAKFESVLSAVKAARVLQIENKMDALVDVGLAEVIPLVSPTAQ